MRGIRRITPTTNIVRVVASASRLGGVEGNRRWRRSNLVLETELMIKKEFIDLIKRRVIAASIDCSNNGVIFGTNSTSNLKNHII